MEGAGKKEAKDKEFQRELTEALGLRRMEQFPEALEENRARLPEMERWLKDE